MLRRAEHYGHAGGVRKELRIETRNRGGAEDAASTGELDPA